jgi:transcription initiation factor IIE alpha subunit
MMTNEQTMTEFKCQDCGRSVDVVDCTGGVYLCIRCLNRQMRARNARDDAAEAYQHFLDAGGRAN